MLPKTALEFMDWDWPQIEPHYAALAARTLSPDNVAEWLAVLDVVVVPSLKESFGIVVLEAQAAGIPVVASNTGGIPWVADRGGSALLFPAGDAEALADSVRRVIHDEQLSRRLVERGKRNVAERFSLDTITDRYIALYEQAIMDIGRQPN